MKFRISLAGPAASDLTSLQHLLPRRPMESSSRDFNPIGQGGCRKRQGPAFPVTHGINGGFNGHTCSIQRQGTDGLGIRDSRQMNLAGDRLDPRGRVTPSFQRVALLVPDHARVGHARAGREQQLTGMRDGAGIQAAQRRGQRKGGTHGHPWP